MEVRFNDRSDWMLDSSAGLVLAPT
jgi:hypothetical protein